MDPLLIALICTVLGGLLIVLGIKFLPGLKNEEQGYPLEVQVEAMLLPLVFQGICTAYKVSELAVDEMGARLEGVDKAKIANMLYDLLPESVGGFPLEIVKTVVSRERFAELVQDAFHRFNAHYLTFQGKYTVAYLEWVREYRASGIEDVEL